MFISKEDYYKKMFLEFDEPTILTHDLNGVETEGVFNTIMIGIKEDYVSHISNKFYVDENIVFLSAVVIALTKYTSSKDVIFSTYYNDTNFSKLLPIIFKTNRSMSLRDFFNLVNDNWTKMTKYASDYYNVANEYGFSSDFTYIFHDKNINLDNLDAFNNSTSKIIINVFHDKNEYLIEIKYNDALYSYDYIKTFLNSIKRIIEEFDYYNARLDSTMISDIVIVKENNNLKFRNLKINTINKLFEDTASKNHEDLALIASDGRYTYDELNRKSNRVAHALINRGVKVGSKIIHMLPRDSNLIIAMLGILKTGSCFIPVATDYPKERVKYIYENSEADYIISNFNLPHAISVDTLLSESSDESNTNIEVTGDNLAYMIYTSGSTGNPKGVMVSNENICNLLACDKENIIYNIYNQVKSVLGITTVSFDVSILDLLAPLAFGLTLIFADDNQIRDLFSLINLLNDTKPEFVLITPSRLLQYMELDAFKEVLYNFKCIVSTGEKFPKHLLNLMQNYPEIKVYNAYGPTETTVESNIKLINTDEDITVGKSLFNLITDVRDIDGKLLPDGAIGELYIGGKGVAKGYYKLPEKTHDVFKKINQINYYRSGDYAIRNNDEISIIGRMDNQIKLRGFRIEIGEVESVISDYDGITQVVVVIKNVNNTDHLCAYYTSNKDIDVDDLKEKISSKLTEYMVPTIYIHLENMPKTPNAKIDVKNLPNPQLTSKYVPPSNELELFITETYSNILGIDNIGATDNFFDLGGNSLNATKITIAAVNKGYNISYGDVFDNPTPRKLTTFIKSNNSNNKEDNIEDYDYSQINDLLNKNNLKTFKKNKTNQSLGNILLTGATGFLGIHVLKELIDEEGEIYLLLRKKESISTIERLKSLLFYYFEKTYDELFNNRIHIINGDITNKDDLKKLNTYTIDTVINCAANVKYFSSNSTIMDVNYHGVLNLIDFSKNNNCKLIHISTESVGGLNTNNSSNTELYENELYIGQKFNNNYMYSKFLAERAILEAIIEHNLNAKIIRIGNIMARSYDSRFQINFNSNAYINILKTFISLGKIPDYMFSEDAEFSPVDLTAKSIITLSKTPDNCIIFHPHNKHAVSYSVILNILRQLGYDIEIVSAKEFNNSLKDALKDKDKQKGVSGFITSGIFNNSRDFIYTSSDYTFEILYMMNFTWPLINEKYIYLFIKHLKELNFFDN